MCINGCRNGRREREGVRVFGGSHLGASVVLANYSLQGFGGFVLVRGAGGCKGLMLGDYLPIQIPSRDFIIVRLCRQPLKQNTQPPGIQTQHSATWYSNIGIQTQHSPTSFRVLGFRV